MRLSLRIRKAIFPFFRWVNRWVRPDVRAGGPPTGVFSEEDSLRLGVVTGRSLSPLEPFPEIPIDSEVREARLDQDRHQRWKLLWTQRDHAFLAAPSFAHIDDGDRVCQEAVFGVHGWSDPVWRRKGPRSVRRLSGDFTSVVSRWNRGQNYFHWFLDGLTRLVHLSEFPDDCRILVPANLPQFARSSLKILGLDQRLVEVGSEDLEIERYWFAGPTMLSGCPDPTGVNWLRKQFLQGSEPRAHRMIYVERRASTRRVVNASEVKSVFMDFGWEAVDPSRMELDEQIALFREANLVAGAHGAGLTNLLWSPKGCRVLEFMPSRRRNGCYAGIALVVGGGHRALVCDSNRSGDIEVPLDALKSELRAMEQDGGLDSCN